MDSNPALPLADQLVEFRRTHPLSVLDVNGVRWEYIASGSGPLLVILGGGLSTAESAFRSILRLEDRFRVISPNYPPEKQLDVITQGLAALIAHEGAAADTTRAHVWGHSLGAMTGHALVRLQPDAVDKLVLDGFGLYTKGHVLTARLFFSLPFSFLKAYYTRAMQRLTSTAADEDARFWAAYTAEIFAGFNTKKAFMGQMGILLDLFDNASRYRTFEPVHRPGQVLLLLARDDRGFSPLERQALIDTYPGAAVHWFSEGGHLAGLTNTQEFNQTLDAFLGNQGDPAAS